MSLRLQTAEIQNFAVTPRQDGQEVMTVTAIMRHPGVLTYRTDSGTRRELVTPEFIRALDSKDFPYVGQVGNAPVTDEHPNGLIRKDDAAAEIREWVRHDEKGRTVESGRIVDAVYGELKFDSVDELPVYDLINHADSENPRGKVVGKVKPQIKIYKDGNVEVQMEVTDSVTMDSVRSGKKKGVSLGYQCNVVKEDGEWRGESYTHRQAAPLKVDHLAIVANPRAPEALIKRFDSPSDDIAWAVPGDQVSIPVHVFVPKQDACSCEDESKEQVFQMDKSKQEKAQMDAAESSTTSVVLGGQSQRIDSAVADALLADGLLHRIKLDGREYLLDSEIVGALRSDGLIESPVATEPKPARLDGRQRRRRSSAKGFGN